MIFRENYVKKIMAFTDTPFVKVLTGVRRCGKSTIMQMIMGKLRKKDIRDGKNSKLIIRVSRQCTWQIFCFQKSIK